MRYFCTVFTSVKVESTRFCIIVYHSDLVAWSDLIARPRRSTVRGNYHGKAVHPHMERGECHKNMGMCKAAGANSQSHRYSHFRGNDVLGAIMKHGV